MSLSVPDAAEDEKQRKKTRKSARFDVLIAKPILVDMRLKEGHKNNMHKMLPPLVHGKWPKDSTCKERLEHVLDHVYVHVLLFTLLFLDIALVIAMGFLDNAYLVSQTNDYDAALKQVCVIRAADLTRSGVGWVA